MTINEDMIRRKAYQLWMARGCPLGSAESDWHAAQSMLRKASDSTETPSANEPRYGLRLLGSESPG